MTDLRPMLALIALIALTCASSSAQQPQAQPRRSITRLTGDLYRVQNNDHYTSFLVTPAGIILADPINVGAASWLKAQLAERFPNAPVRYVLYSHHHQDHASGAAVFNDTAEIVAHENFSSALKAAAGQNAAAAGTVRGSGPSSQHWLVGSQSDPTYDAVVPPESTYTSRRTIALGGKTVELIHPGRMGHAPDFTVMLFPAERVVFAVDFVAIKTVPGSNTLGGGAAIGDYVNAIKTVEALNFDIAAPGHGPVGTKADVAAHRQYYEHLAARVSAAVAAGRTLQQLQAAKIMDEYRDWIEYDEDNDINIANAYKTLSAQKR